MQGRVSSFKFKHTFDDNYLLAVKQKHYSNSVALSNMMESTEKISLGEQTVLSAMIEDYKSYKKGFLRSMKYDPKSFDLGKCMLPLPDAVELE